MFPSHDRGVWSEQNRLHIAYRKCKISDGAASVGNNVDAEVTLNLTEAGASEGAIRVGQTILMSDVATGLIVQKALVQKVTSSSGSKKDQLEVKFYGTTTLSLPDDVANSINLFVYGSDFGKGTVGMDGSIEPQFTQFSNSPIILKDNFKINGSDTAPDRDWETS